MSAEFDLEEAVKISEAEDTTGVWVTNKQDYQAGFREALELIQQEFGSLYANEHTTSYQCFEGLKKIINKLKSGGR